MLSRVCFHESDFFAKYPRVSLSPYMPPKGGIAKFGNGNVSFPTLVAG